LGDAPVARPCFFCERHHKARLWWPRRCAYVPWGLLESKVL